LSYLLDTNACIAGLNGRPRTVAERIASAIARQGAVSVSTVSIFELWYGIGKSTHVEQNALSLDAFLDPLHTLSFDFEDARVAGEIRARLERAGKPIGPYDYLIAAQALRRELTVVTANVKEFSRVSGLRWENWSS
jgi:tRNA(fMet)-specific endonuclease VapC